MNKHETPPIIFVLEEQIEKLQAENEKLKAKIKELENWKFEILESIPKLKNKTREVESE